MTSQEQQLLQDLTSKINGTVLQDKDPEAEQYLTASLARNPDALYILAQTVLVQNYALTQAQAQLAQLKQQMTQQPQAPPPAQKHTSFLGNLLGINDDPAPPPPPATQIYPPTSQAGYMPVQNAPVQSYPPQNYGAPQANYGQPQYAQPQYGQPQYAQPQGGGFLRSAMQTATGVAAGALAFQGIESLLGGFEHHAGYGGGGQGFGEFGGGQPREEVINNYYGDSDRDRGSEGREEHRFGDDLPDKLSPDIEDRRDANSGGRDFADTDDSDNSGYDDSGQDDSGQDDSGQDDFSGNDDNS